MAWPWRTGDPRAAFPGELSVGESPYSPFESEAQRQGRGKAPLEGVTTHHPCLTVMALAGPLQSLEPWLGVLGIPLGMGREAKEG